MKRLWDSFWYHWYGLLIKLHIIRLDQTIQSPEEDSEGNMVANMVVEPRYFWRKRNSDDV